MHGILVLYYYYIIIIIVADVRAADAAFLFLSGCIALCRFASILFG